MLYSLIFYFLIMFNFNEEKIYTEINNPIRIPKIKIKGITTPKRGPVNGTVKI